MSFVQHVNLYLPVIQMGERGSCRAWLWFGRSLSLPVLTTLPPAKKQFPMSTARSFCRSLLTLALVGFALAVPMAVAVAAPAEEQDFAALQAETKRVFKDRVAVPA